jgi:sulfoquinovosidase
MLLNFQEYEYMLGPDLLVAPVLLPGVDTWSVYLPGSVDISWIHLWSGQLAGTGGQMAEVAAPLGEPPVFYPADSAWADAFAAIGQEFKLPGHHIS